MADTLHLKVVSPSGVLYEDEAEKVTIPTQNGAITVYVEHMPLVSVLYPGELVIHKPNGDVTGLAISQGVLEVRHDSKVYVMADTAEHASDIDVDRAEKARARAEELLKQQQHVEDVDFARLQAQLEKEMARLGVAKRYRG